MHDYCERTCVHAYNIHIAHTIADNGSNRVWHRNFKGKEVLGDLRSYKKLVKNGRI